MYSEFSFTDAPYANGIPEVHLSTSGTQKYAVSILLTPYLLISGAGYQKSFSVSSIIVTVYAHSAPSQKINSTNSTTFKGILLVNLATYIKSSATIGAIPNPIYAGMQLVNGKTQPSSTVYIYSAPRAKSKSTTGIVSTLQLEFNGYQGHVSLSHTDIASKISSYASNTIEGSNRILEISIPFLVSGDTKTYSKIMVSPNLGISGNALQSSESQSAVLAPLLLQFLEKQYINNEGHPVISSTLSGDLVQAIQEIATVFPCAIYTDGYVSTVESTEYLFTHPLIVPTGSKLSKFSGLNTLILDLNFAQTASLASYYRELGSKRFSLSNMQNSVVYHEFVLPTVDSGFLPSSYTLAVPKNTVGVVITADTQIHLILTMNNGAVYDLGQNTIFILSNSVSTVQFINDLNISNAQVSYIVA